MGRCGELAMEEAMDLSKGNLRNKNKGNYF